MGNDTLMIVESPAKARTIGKLLGAGTKVLASMGHVSDLPQRELGVDIVHDFAPQYELTPNDAADLTVDAKVFSANSSYEPNTVEWTGVTATSTVDLRQVVDSFNFNHSFNSTDDFWQVELTMHYKLFGVDRTETVNIPPDSAGMRSWRPAGTLSRDADGTIITISSQEGDPFTYAVTGISSIEVDWYTNTDDGNWNWLGSEALYPESGFIMEQIVGSQYVYVFPMAELSPPEAATHFMVSVVSEAPYTGTYGSNTYTSTGPLTIYGDFQPVSDLTP